jgi:hypothetical protein
MNFRQVAENVMPTEARHLSLYGQATNRFSATCGGGLWQGPRQLITADSRKEFHLVELVACLYLSPPPENAQFSRVGELKVQS